MSDRSAAVGQLSNANDNKLGFMSKNKQVTKIMGDVFGAYVAVCA